MKCPHLARVLMKFCVAERDVYVSSICELRKYYNHQQHKMCQFYSHSENSRAKTSNAPVCRDIARTIE
jgi:hypothetical protein